jgi:hypothetical protein
VQKKAQFEAARSKHYNEFLALKQLKSQGMQEEDDDS